MDMPVPASPKPSFLQRIDKTVGYYLPNPVSAEKAMRPSSTLNAIVDAIRRNLRKP